MFAIIIFTLATSTQANVLFPDDDKLDDKPKIEITKSVAVNTSTDMCDPSNYPDSVITNLIKRNGSFDKFFKKDEGSIKLLTGKRMQKDIKGKLFQMAR